MWEKKYEGRGNVILPEFRLEIGGGTPVRRFDLHGSRRRVGKKSYQSPFSWRIRNFIMNPVKPVVCSSSVYGSYTRSSSTVRTQTVDKTRIPPWGMRYPFPRRLPPAVTLRISYFGSRTWERRQRFPLRRMLGVSV